MPRHVDDRILTLRLQSDGSFILTGGLKATRQFIQELKERGVGVGESYFTLCG